MGKFTQLDIYKEIHDNDGSHFDENVFWLHVSVKDPTAVTKTRGTKVKLLDADISFMINYNLQQRDYVYNPV